MDWVHRPVPASPAPAKRDVLSVHLADCPANGTVQWTPRSKVKLPTVNKRLMAKASVTGNVGITANYYSEV